MFFVYNDWYSLSIIHDFDRTLLLVNVYSQNIHFLVPLVVICCIDQHFVEDFVKGGNKADIFVFKEKAIFRQNPARRSLVLNRTYVGVWPK